MAGAGPEIDASLRTRLMRIDDTELFAEAEGKASICGIGTEDLTPAPSSSPSISTARRSAKCRLLVEAVLPRWACGEVEVDDDPSPGDHRLLLGMAEDDRRYESCSRCGGESRVDQPILGVVIARVGRCAAATNAAPPENDDARLCASSAQFRWLMGQAQAEGAGRGTAIPAC
jgi:hypothetical protein